MYLNCCSVVFMCNTAKLSIIILLSKYFAFRSDKILPFYIFLPKISKKILILCYTLMLLFKITVIINLNN